MQIDKNIRKTNFKLHLFSLYFDVVRTLKFFDRDMSCWRTYCTYINLKIPTNTIFIINSPYQRIIKFVTQFD